MIPSAKAQMPVKQWYRVCVEYNADFESGQKKLWISLRRFAMFDPRNLALTRSQSVERCQLD